MTFSYNLTAGLNLIAFAELAIGMSLLLFVFYYYPDYKRNQKFNRWLKKLGDNGKHISGRMISKMVDYPSGQSMIDNINYYVDHILK